MKKIAVRTSAKIPASEERVGGGQDRQYQDKKGRRKFYRELFKGVKK